MFSPCLLYRQSNEVNLRVLIVAGEILPGLVASTAGKQIAALFLDEEDLCLCHIPYFSSGKSN